MFQRGNLPSANSKGKSEPSAGCLPGPSPPGPGRQQRLAAERAARPGAGPWLGRPKAPGQAASFPRQGPRWAATVWRRCPLSPRLVWKPGRPRSTNGAGAWVGAVLCVAAGVHSQLWHPNLGSAEWAGNCVSCTDMQATRLRHWMWTGVMLGQGKVTPNLDSPSCISNLPPPEKYPQSCVFFHLNARV